ncbi:HEAT repeat domain-containing protein [Bdellovibrio sp. HCB337]|uniref:HEAT repeat domain-containing protein n=1 Tax=Bdellovibrio sp. HCB337 TaxID=3394358 RepID=UPI0039A540A4
MKQILFKAAVLALIPSAATFAAIPAGKPNLRPKVMEILNLPPENRSQAVLTTTEDMYKEFISVAFAEDQSMRLRWRALMLAAEGRREKATPDLLKAGAHKQWFMRNAALVALAEVNQGEAQKLAKKLLKDKALVVRSAAVDVLQKNPRPEVRDLLWEEMNQKYNYRNKESLWIRAQIVDAMAQTPADHELKIFNRLLNDKDTRVQAAAVGGMEKLTGVKLGDNNSTREKLVLLWKDYARKEKLAL